MLDEAELPMSILATGVAVGFVSSILTVLEERGIELPDDAPSRLNGWTDFEQLRLLLRRAVSVTSLDELFEGATL